MPYVVLAAASMSCRVYPMTEERRERWIKEGRGVGDGANYRGWLETTDVSSTGHKHRRKERLHGRLCHWLSDVEYHAAIIYQCSPSLTELLDQFPLPVSETLAIAKELRVDHPTDPNSGVPITMTTDIVLKVATPRGLKTIPRNAKDMKGIENYNNMEHAEIERRWWLSKGCELKFVTNSAECMPKPLLNNAKEIEQHYWIHTDIQAYDGYLDDVREHILAKLSVAKESARLWELCANIDEQIGLIRGATLKIAYHWIGHLALRVDLGGKPIRQQDVLDIKRRTFEIQAPSLHIRGVA